ADFSLMLDAYHWFSASPETRPNAVVGTVPAMHSASPRADCAHGSARRRARHTIFSATLRREIEIRALGCQVKSYKCSVPDQFADLAAAQCAPRHPRRRYHPITAPSTHGARLSAAAA